MAQPQLITMSEPPRNQVTGGKCSACGALMYAMTGNDIQRVFAAHVKEQHSRVEVNQPATRSGKEAT